MAVAPERWYSPAQSRHITLGDLTISYVPDGYVELEPEGWYRTTTFPTRPPVSEDGYLIGSVGSVVIHEADGLVVIDAGLGPLQLPRHRTHPSLGTMRGGLNPEYATLGDERIKALAITHAHEDHVGWIGAGQRDRLNPEQVFVGAPDAASLAHLTGTINVGALHGGEQISDSVRAIHTPGHTAGHMSYMVESRGERALIFGDVFHSPVQFHDTAMGPWSDENPDQARRSRKLVAELLTEPHTVGIGYHFADVVFGTLSPKGWLPLHD